MVLKLLIIFSGNIERFSFYFGKVKTLMKHVPVISHDTYFIIVMSFNLNVTR